ncbi:hypothetical protein DENIS_2839 [Desulfonema ishimotonii]|uniref:Uncharacterized protein n=1 Tax=Desulfonema ishimotonii TaxID=45657 RepID=A0A401FY25_9BACT|nr:hypothetical protein [Desulfonema ishimotonii]GBC61877.1 hypothetical protein DENIS_2839 [Desulfonema ishimotonii]
MQEEKSVGNPWEMFEMVAAMPLKGMTQMMELMDEGLRVQSEAWDRRLEFGNCVFKHSFGLMLDTFSGKVCGPGRFFESVEDICAGISASMEDESAVVSLHETDETDPENEQMPKAA